VCTYNFNFFAPIQVVTHGNTVTITITITIDGLAPCDVVLFWLSPDVTAAATTDAHGQAHVTVAPASYLAAESESSSYVLPPALVGGALMLAGAGVVVGRRRKSDPQY
jgi:LPXTG-motif cell wall-anchored protein